jgi:ABC-2 type transport system ATP-binding protein
MVALYLVGAYAIFTSVLFCSSIDFRTICNMLIMFFIVYLSANSQGTISENTIKLNPMAQFEHLKLKIIAKGGDQNLNSADFEQILFTMICSSVIHMCFIGVYLTQNSLKDKFIDAVHFLYKNMRQFLGVNTRLNDIPVAFDSSVELEKIAIESSNFSDCQEFARLCNVEQRHGLTNIVNRNVWLRIPQNQCIGLLGPSGCGKTHIIDAIAGLRKPSSGVVFHAKPGIIGLCSQENKMLMTNSLERNLYTLARIRGLSHEDANDATEKVARMVGLTDSIKKPLSIMSGGMQRRGVIAMASVGGARLIIADEPTTSLDVHHKALIQKILMELTKMQDRSIMIVSHDMDEIRRVCKSIVMLYGTVLTVGTAEEICSRYSNAWRIRVRTTTHEAEKNRQIIFYSLHSLGSDITHEPTPESLVRYIESHKKKIDSIDTEVKIEFKVQRSRTGEYNLADVYRALNTGGCIELGFEITAMDLEDAFFEIIRLATTSSTLLAAA